MPKINDPAKPKALPRENDYKGFKVIFNALTQRHIEKWREYSDPAGKDKTVPQANGDAVRAAVRAGWFELPVLSISDGNDPIAEFPPDRVNWLAQLIADKYVEVMYVDPNS